MTLRFNISSWPDEIQFFEIYKTPLDLTTPIQCEALWSNARARDQEMMLPGTPNVSSAPFFLEGAVSSSLMCLDAGVLTKVLQI